MAEDYVEFNEFRQAETAEARDELLLQTESETKRIAVEAYNRPLNQAIESARNEANSQINEMKEKIPAQASADNQLATQSYVNEAVQTSSAINRGSFATYADLLAYSGPVTRNDYATVGDDETHGHEAWRYKWNDETEQWTPEYRINEAPMTTEQLAALNSGATSDLIAELNRLLASSYAAIFEKTQAEYDALPEADRTNEHKIFLIKANDGSKYIKLCYKDKELISSGGGGWIGTHEEYNALEEPLPKNTTLFFTDDYDSEIGNPNYSTEETYTGKKWIDGKKIYRKVVEAPTFTNSNPLNVNIPNINKVIDIRQMRRYDNRENLWVCGDGQASPNSLYFSYENNGISIHPSGSSTTIYSFTAIIDYTKTTD